MGQIGITYPGQTMIARQLSGETFTFTSMKIGTGIIPNGTELANLTDLITPIKSVSIYEVSRETDDEALLKAYYDNKDFTSPKTITEFGIFAKIGEEAEQLYAYIDSSDSPDSMPAYSTATFKNIIKKLIIKVGNASTTQAIINQSEVFATVEMLNNRVTNLNTELEKKIDKNLVTALNDFIIGSGEGTLIKKTLAEIKILLGLDAIGLGVEQTWQNLTTARALNTTYTNTTGKPIVVMVQAAVSGAGANIEIYVNSVLAFKSAFGSTAGFGTGFGGIVIVPPGGTYNASGNSLSYWAELR